MLFKKQHFSALLRQEYYKYYIFLKNLKAGICCASVLK